jgi:DNA-binding transcriptional MerR regulator
VKALPTGKLYYSISEVSDLVGVKPHVLRYWETQFKMLRPRKGRGGARMYRKRDVEVLFDIRQLLYDQRFTIAGARRKILDDKQDPRDQIELPFTKLDREETIRALKKDMESLLAMLKQDAAKRARSR